MPDAPPPAPSCLLTCCGWGATLVYAVVTGFILLWTCYEVWQVWLWLW
jgi:hypothetical protein